MALISSIGAGCPNRCTGMMARVRGVMAASISAGLIVERIRVDIDEDRVLRPARTRLRQWR
jgi:hypothetical protein